VNGKLMKVDANGGPPQTVCALSGSTILSRGGAWNADGTIVFSRGPGGLYKIASTGGEPVPITKAEAPAEADVFPSFLPDGRHILFYKDVNSDAEKSGIFVTTLDADDSTHLLDADSAVKAARAAFASCSLCGRVRCSDSHSIRMCSNCRASQCPWRNELSPRWFLASWRSRLPPTAPLCTALALGTPPVFR
jgi:hypothetical protein